MIPAQADVRFSPGDQIEAEVQNAQVGTVFLFSSGVYEGVSVEPGPDQMFIGEAGAVLDGMGASSAFRSSSPNVTVANLEITGYEPASKDGVIQGDPGAKAWTVAGNDIHHNSEIGIDGGAEWHITSNAIHHNGRYGITNAGNDVLVEGNEIFCNAIEIGASGDSGGTKFVHTVDLVLRDNYVHHNYGNGLWADINNLNTLIESNRLVTNERAGAFIEISCGGIIRNNVVEDNGHGNPFPNRLAESSGIMVTDTPDVEIYGNTLLGNEKGIGAIQDDRDGGDVVSHCDPRLENLKVHDNQITQSGGAAAGIDASAFRLSVWTTSGNIFFDNVYELSDGAEFRWGGSWVSADEWQAMGQD